MKVFYFLATIAFFAVSSYQIDRDMECSACRAVTDELIYLLDKTHTDETFIRGHKLNSEHSPGVKRSYYLSEAHIYNMLDSVCKAMEEYGMINEKPNRMFVRNVPREGEEEEQFTVHGNFNFAEDIVKTLRYTCNILVEDNEELLTKLFKEGQITDFCDYIDACKEYEQEAPDDGFVYDEL